MNYARFKKKMEERITEFLPEDKKDWTVKMVQVPKVNRVLDGMTLMPPDQGDGKPTVGLTFYMEDYYDLFRKGVAIEELLQEIAEMTETCKPPEAILENGCDPGKIKNLKEQIVMEVVHAERNRELLENMPHRSLLDLAVIYRILIFDEKCGYACIPIDYTMMELLETTEAELFDTAYEYMPQELPFSVQNFENQILILSNSQQMYGASALLFPDVLDMACDMLDGDIYIIPASGDKLCVERTDTPHWQKLQKRLWDMYHSGDDPDDLLSDHYYMYRRHSGKVTAA